MWGQGGVTVVSVTFFEKEEVLSACRLCRGNFLIGEGSGKATKAGRQKWMTCAATSINQIRYLSLIP